jgi:hypothetical protein
LLSSEKTFGKGLSMLLPRGKDIWIKLRTSFVYIDELFIYLKENEFTGYIQFLFSDEEAVIFMEEGDVISGIISDKFETKNSTQSINQILEKARKSRDGRINVSQFPTETISILSEVFEKPMRRIHQDLYSEFSDLERFIKKLQHETFSGYIEIHFPKDQRTGMELIVFSRGEMTAIFAQGLQFRVNKENKQDIKKITNYIKVVQNRGARYSVYANP